MGIFAQATQAGAADPDGVRSRVDGIAALMRARLGARGRSLRDTLRHSGHHLPDRVRAEARFLAECADLAGHPRLIQRLDSARMDRAEAACRSHLDRIDRWSRRGALALAALRQVVFILLATAALGLGLALWRGLI